jgi:moderate conductance mechanosensitive channel
VSGFSILLENYYLVGDYVKINDDEGFVESVDISNTRIRDEEGRQHIFRNGDIKKVVNFSKEKSCAIVELRVSYESKINKIKELVLSCNDTIRKECDGVIEDINFQGIEEFDDIGILIRTLTKTEPGKHLEVERQIREILKAKFDEEGIKIPYSWKENSFSKNKPTV